MRVQYSHFSPFHPHHLPYTSVSFLDIDTSVSIPEAPKLSRKPVYIRSWDQVETDQLKNTRVGANLTSLPDRKVFPNMKVLVKVI